jgi:SAM-dependent methyltransferase
VVDRLFAEPWLAALYDLWSPGEQRDDFAFYRPLVMAAPRVLDVGCGTGELLGMARQAGHSGRLCGLDPADAMLARARRRPGGPGVEWVLGDLGSVSWAQEFDLVVMSGHAFQVLLADEEIRSALAAIRRALVPGGRLAFETRNPPARTWERWTPEHPVEATGAAGTFRMEHQVELPTDGEYVSFTTTFTSPGWDDPQTSRSTLRFLDAGPLGEFLAGAGLDITEQYGDWDRQPLTETSPEIITIATRPTG